MVSLMVESFDEDFSLWRLMTQAVYMASKIRTKELNEFGISAPESAVLGFLVLTERSSDKKTTIIEITKWLSRSPNSTSELISRMEKKELIKKARNTLNKKEVTLEITEKGRNIHKLTTNRKSIHDIFSSLNDEERQYLWIALGKIRNYSSKILGVDKPSYPIFL
jgi:DNA-binding MarR family transcriptional regulator